MKSKLHFLVLFFLSLSVYSQSTNSIDEIAGLELKGASGKRFTAVQSGYQAYDVSYSRCNWVVDPAVNFIEGCVVSYFYAEQNGLTQITFDCSSALTVDSIIGHQQSLTFSRSGDLLEINLLSTLAAGDIDSLAIYYHGAPVATGNGSFTQSTHNGHPVIWTLSEPYGAMDWWPCRQNVADKIDSMDIFCSIPIGNRCGSNGRLISIDTAFSQCTYHWKTIYPIAPYLVAIAVTNYQEDTSSVILQNGDVLPIVNYVYPENTSLSLSGLSVTSQLVSFFDSLLTTYPFSKEKYGHAEFGWGGGMEHQTMTFLGSFGFEIVAHELAHQWFGDKISCGTWEDIWLNEGFATFISGLAIERYNSSELYSWKYAAVKNITSIPNGTVICSDTSSLSRIFDGRLSYRKGSYVLEMLRWKLGDQIFFQGLRNYLLNANVAYSYAATNDLQSDLEAAAGISLAQFFDEWVYKEGFPSYRIEWSGGSENVHLKISQSTSDASVPFFHIPIELQFGNSQLDTLVRIEPTQSEESFDLVLDFVPDYLSFDPNLRIISAKNSVVQMLPPGALNEMIELFPNPAHSELTFFSERAQLNPRNFQLYDGLGRLVYSHALSGLQKEAVVLNPMPAGLYIVKISTSQGDVFKKLIIEN